MHTHNIYVYMRFDRKADTKLIKILLPVSQIIWQCPLGGGGMFYAPHAVLFALALQYTWQLTEPLECIFEQL